MSENCINTADAYLSRIKAARSAPAVLKTRLVALRSVLPRSLVLAFEGNDDKTVYFQWIRRINPNIKYEPFPCDGKEQVLQLKDIIDRDLGGLSQGLYFFVDRDFDDLRGRKSCDRIYMTKAYSIENYLVDELVLEELLKDEFHCHVEIECRSNVVNLFSTLYERFLKTISPVNERLFFARRLNMEPTVGLPTKASKLANIGLDSVTKSEVTELELIKLPKDPTPLEIAQLQPEFNGFDPRSRHRGKFSFLFFTKWLENLAQDRNSDVPKYFPRITNGSKVRFQDLNLASYASKSRLPEGLPEFVMQMKF